MSSLNPSNTSEKQNTPSLKQEHRLQAANTVKNQAETILK